MQNNEISTMKYCNK